MSSVNITTERNTVTVNGDTNVVTVATRGPQGPQFSTTGTNIGNQGSSEARPRNIAMMYVIKF